MHVVDHRQLQSANQPSLRAGLPVSAGRPRRGGLLRGIRAYRVVALTRSSAGSSFEDFRRRQVEEIGNRPAFTRLREEFEGIEGCVTVATCCRFELHLQFAPDAPALREPQKLLEGFARLLGLPVSADTLKRFDWLEGTDALEHLLWTAIGGESILPGETEILGQLKDAYRQAQEDEHLQGASLLHLVFQRAFHAAGQMRYRSFGTGGWSASLPRLAVTRLREAWAEAHGAPETWPRPQMGAMSWPGGPCRLAIVGAGNLALGVASRLIREGFPASSLVFYVRNIERARARLGFPAEALARPVEALLDDWREDRFHGIIGAVTHPLTWMESLWAWSGIGENGHPVVPLVDLSVPAMLSTGLRWALAGRVNYIDFETLMAECDARRQLMTERLAEVRREVVRRAQFLARDIARREALMGNDFEALRRLMGNEGALTCPAEAVSLRVIFNLPAGTLRSTERHERLEKVKEAHLQALGIS